MHKKYFNMENYPSTKLPLHRITFAHSYLHNELVIFSHIFMEPVEVTHLCN